MKKCAESIYKLIGNGGSIELLVKYFDHAERTGSIIMLYNDGLPIGFVCIYCQNEDYGLQEDHSVFVCFNCDNGFLRGYLPQLPSDLYRWISNKINAYAPGQYHSLQQGKGSVDTVLSFLEPYSSDMQRKELLYEVENRTTDTAGQDLINVFFWWPIYFIVCGCWIGLVFHIVGTKEPDDGGKHAFLSGLCFFGFLIPVIGCLALKSWFRIGIIIITVVIMMIAKV